MKVILFDGVCNLCNGSVNWLIDHDLQHQFKYASLQSDYGKRKVKEMNLEHSYMDTFIFDDDGKFFTQSTAAIQILRKIGGIYSLAAMLLVIPRFIRDAVYNLVANNRYKWFGKSDTCRLPTPELKEKFLE